MFAVISDGFGECGWKTVSLQGFQANSEEPVSASGLSFPDFQASDFRLQCRQMPECCTCIGKTRCINASHKLL